MEGGDIAKARSLIAAGADAKGLVQTTDPYQRMTVLMEAARLGNADMIALLLDSGAILEAVDRLGRTALSYAVQKPEGAEAALLLIGKGAKAEAPSFDSRGQKTAILKAAALNGMLAVVDALAPGAGEAGKKQLAEAMRWVGAQGKVDLVEALLSRGIEPEWDDMDRSDSLVRAAGAGYLDVVIALMKGGARADSPDAAATTPLMAAAANGRLEVISFLLGKGAKPSDEILADGRLDLVELILSSKTKQEDFYKKTRLNQLLCIAAKAGDVQLAALAFSKGADPNMEYYDNPLALAIEHDSVAVASLLLD